jgi:hypothetical protein
MTAQEILSIHTDVFNRALKEQDYAALEGLVRERLHAGTSRWFRAE